MTTLAKISFVLALSMWACGCATTSSTNSYQALGAAANSYTSNLSSLIDAAAEAEIERSSFTLIDKNLSYSDPERTQADFAGKQINDYSSITDGSREYLAELARVKQHLYLFHEYFKLMADYVGSNEGDKTAKSIIGTAGAINTLFSTINDNDVFALTDEAGNKLTAASKYVFSFVQKKTLSERIKADYGFISKSLLTHESVLRALGGDLIDDLEAAGESDTYINLVRPLTRRVSPFTSQASTEQWRVKRRQILLNAFNIESLALASKSAKKFAEALDAVANKSPNSLAVIDSFVSELEYLKTTIDTIR